MKTETRRVKRKTELHETESLRVLSESTSRNEQIKHEKKENFSMLRCTLAVFYWNLDKKGINKNDGNKSVYWKHETLKV